MRIPTPIRSTLTGLRRRQWSFWSVGWLEVAFIALLALSLAMRLWELGSRAMHYDEAIHVHFSWQLANGQEYHHSPWMHGPFQIELTALFLKMPWDNDFIARLAYVLFGIGLVALPYLFREHLGRAGALLAAVMLSFSPTLLYFSRFGRNDIIMAFWATALFILMWQYLHRGKDRYLYLASAVLALMFATKETAYIIVLIFGGILFLLALPDLIPWVLRRTQLSLFAGASGFLILMVTLLLPQGSALVGALLQGPLELELVTPSGTDTGLVGAPQWTAPFLALPVYPAPWWALVVAFGLLGAVLYLVSGARHNLERPSLLAGTFSPLLAVMAIVVLAFPPLGSAASYTLSGGLFQTSVVLLAIRHYPWKRGILLVMVPSLLTLLYLALFTPVVNVGVLLGAILPNSIQVDTSINGIPANFLVAAGVMLSLLLISVYFGMRWRGGVWLACAGIFYFTWSVLFTTLFTNWAGIFSGAWQGMGYWIAQQEVARGNQPWYYYLVGLSVYEFLPVIFGCIGGLYYLKKGDILGLALAVWSGLTLLAYTIATEKMPWLVVNITLPFILLAGRYLGDLAGGIPWGLALRRGGFIMTLLAPLILVAGIYFLMSYVDSESLLSGSLWTVLLGLGVLSVVAAYVARLVQPRNAVPLAALGIAVLLFGFGVWGALRASYTYDDSNVEILVYAQGSADLPTTFDTLDREVFRQQPPQGAVAVDYDLWYPFQWYVRHQQREGVLQFRCFKAEGEEGHDASCNPPSEEEDSRSFLLTAAHAPLERGALSSRPRVGPLRNLLWFPETYRRPGENRQEEGMGQQLAEDFKFFGRQAVSRDSWSRVLDYLILRELSSDWYYSEFYGYLP